MSKIRRKKLTRGSVLDTGHVFPFLTEASTPSDADQVKTQWAPFRVNFNFPLLNDAAGVPPSTAGSNVKGKPMSIPFTLPPLQGKFDVNEMPNRDSSSIILDEVSFSFDSMAETGAISIQGGLYRPDAGSVDNCSVDIAILEKSRSLTEMRYDKEVTSFRVPGLALTGSTTERMNPVSVTNLGCVLDPYKMYLMQVSMPDGYAYSKRLYMPNVNVSLRLRHPIVPVTRQVDVQNAPTLYGADSTSAIDIPSAGDEIKATGSGGVATEISKVDEMYMGKLNAGMASDASVDSIRHLAACSGYEVIAVPMFQHPFAIHQKEWDRLPYVDELGQKSSFDRRVIPISEPMIIHHIIAVSNHNSTYPPGTPGGGAEETHPGQGTNMNPAPGLVSTQMPQSTILKYHVGVAMGIGIRSEPFTYEQIAYQEWFPGGATSGNTIDYSSSGSMWSDKAFETLYLPLEGANDGSGYKTTSKPIFVGRGQSSRSDIGGHTSVTAGAEQFIEVRWLIDKPTGLDVAATPATNPEGDVFVGTGGHWVYLICEKRLAGQRS